MRTWIRRLRSVIAVGLTWAIAWAIVGGGIMEGIVDPHGKILDMWPQTLAVPGFLGGVAFACLLWIADRRRQFDDLSMARFAAHGATVGVMLGVAAVILGMGQQMFPLWARSLLIVTPLTLMSAASATGTLALARRGQRPMRSVASALSAM